MTVRAPQREASEVIAGRLDAARAGLSTSAAAALLIGVGSDLRYLTGHGAHPMERLTMLVLPARGDAILVAPRLEAMAARQQAVAAVVRQNPNIQQLMSFIGASGSSTVLNNGRFFALLKPRGQRPHANEIIQQLRREGIGCNNYFPPIHLQPYIVKQFGYKLLDE